MALDDVDRERYRDYEDARDSLEPAMTRREAERDMRDWDPPVLTAEENERKMDELCARLRESLGLEEK